MRSSEIIDNGQKLDLDHHGYSGVLKGHQQRHTVVPTLKPPVAAAGPVPVTELPQTGSNGRLGVASLVLIGVGLGCVVAARRRPA